MTGIIQLRWCEVGTVLNEVSRVKLPCRPTYVILLHVVQKSLYLLVRILHSGSFTPVGSRCIWQECPLTVKEGITTYETRPLLIPYSGSPDSNFMVGMGRIHDIWVANA